MQKFCYIWITLFPIFLCYSLFPCFSVDVSLQKHLGTFKNLCIKDQILKTIHKSKQWLGISVVLPLFHTNNSAFLISGFRIAGRDSCCFKLCLTTPLTVQWKIFHLAYVVISIVIFWSISSLRLTPWPPTSSLKSQACANGWGQECPCHIPRATWWWGSQSTSSTTQFTCKLHHRERKQLPEPKAMSQYR